MKHSTDLVSHLIPYHHDAVTVDSVVTYPPKTSDAAKHWKHTGVCPMCSHRSVSSGRCTNCSWEDWEPLLKSRGLPLPPGVPILQLRYSMGNMDWYAKTLEGWFWMRTQDVLDYEWKACPMGPPGENP